MEKLTSLLISCPEMEQMMQQLLAEMQKLNATVEKQNSRIEQLENELEKEKGKKPLTEEKIISEKELEKEKEISWKAKIKKYGEASSKEEKIIEKDVWQKPKGTHIGSIYVTEFVRLMNYLNSRHANLNEIYSLTDYNKLVADKNTDERLIRAAYQHGLLHVHYIESANQIKMYDEGIVNAYLKLAQLTKAKCIYIRFYTAFAEVTKEGIIPKIEAIKLGITYEKIQYDVCEQELFEENRVHDFLRHKKAIGLLTIRRELESTEGNIWVYENRNNRIIYAPSRARKEEVKKVVAAWQQKIYTPERNIPDCGITAPCISEPCLKILCELSKNQLVVKHQCKYCGKMKKKEEVDYSLPEDIIMKDVDEDSDVEDKKEENAYDKDAFRPDKVADAGDDVKEK
ncbi:putative inclusion body protein [Sweet potato collusive virus]|uniref:Putative inclusion body protein n=1 Tax=Sweet potato collusive virus TaxID=930168 RepID=F2XXY5_9VIRU|nr:putative inclusion body protein [Sweet potato collusive virus]AEA36697.1 putative inclusion body protein [Sweet potato collusive virus]